MTDIKAQNNNEDFINFLILNSQIIKEQGAEFINSITKIAEILDDEQVAAALQEIKK